MPTFWLRRSTQTVLDAVDQVGPPRVSAKPEPMSEDAVHIKVPAVPLPPWVVISLHEIHDHAQRGQNGAGLQSPPSSSNG